MTAANSSQPNNFMAIDYGGVRVGIAVAGSVARLPAPHSTLHNGKTLWDELQKIIEAEDVGTVVVGLPRSLSGRDTDQTAICRDFATQLEQKTGLHVALQDEALTSEQAKRELHARGVQPQRGDLDALAACYILEDYLREH